MAHLIIPFCKAEATTVVSMLTGGECVMEVFDQLFPPHVLEIFSRKPKELAFLETHWKALQTIGWTAEPYSKISQVPDVDKKALPRSDKDCTYYKKGYIWPNEAKYKKGQMLLVRGGKTNRRNKTNEFDGLLEFVNAMQTIFLDHQAKIPASSKEEIPHVALNIINAICPPQLRRTSVLSTEEDSKEDDEYNYFTAISGKDEKNDEMECAAFKIYMGDELWTSSLEDVLQSTTVLELKKSTASTEKQKEIICKLHYEIKSLQSQLQLVEPKNLRVSPQAFADELTIQKCLEYCIGKLIITHLLLIFNNHRLLISHLLARFEGDKIKRARSKKLNLYQPKDGKKDEDNTLSAAALKKLKQSTPGYLCVFAKTNTLTFEVCVACFLHWKQKCMKEGHRIPKKLLSRFCWPQIKAPGVLIRNHKNRCFEKNAKKFCCDPADSRIVTINIPWIRVFAENKYEKDITHSGI